jgi:hypothetical protein
MTQTQILIGIDIEIEEIKIEIEIVDIEVIIEISIEIMMIEQQEIGEIKRVIMIFLIVILMVIENLININLLDIDLQAKTGAQILTLIKKISKMINLLIKVIITNKRKLKKSYLVLIRQVYLLNFQTQSMV